jgi:hypothetical protein
MSGFLLSKIDRYPSQLLLFLMDPSLENFLFTTDVLEDKLLRIDVNLSPIQWIQHKLQMMARIDQTLRSYEITREEKELINDHCKGDYEWYDHKSAAELKDILNMPIVLQSRGWISKDVFGAAASSNAWLIAQHADHDREFQTAVLRRITPFFQAGQINANDYAYLYDRVQVFVLDRQQRYGTQGEEDSKGVWRPWPCETTDLKMIDQEAIKIGMTFKDGSQWTLTEYFKKWHPNNNVDFAFLPTDHPKLEPR